MLKRNIVAGVAALGVCALASTATAVVVDTGFEASQGFPAQADWSDQTLVDTASGIAFTGRYRIWGVANYVVSDGGATFLSMDGRGTSPVVYNLDITPPTGATIEMGAADDMTFWVRRAQAAQGNPQCTATIVYFTADAPDTPKATDYTNVDIYASTTVDCCPQTANITGAGIVKIRISLTTTAGMGFDKMTIDGTVNLAAVTATPMIISPSDGSSLVAPKGSSLHWYMTDAGQTGLRVYLDTVNPPVATLGEVSAGALLTSLGDLAASTTYYAMVEAFNDVSATQSDVVSFTTGADGVTTQPPPTEGLVLHLDAGVGAFADQAGTTPAANGQEVALWQDQSGQGNDMTRGTDINEAPAGLPSLTAAADNGQPSVTFDGTDLLSAPLSSTSFDGDSPDGAPADPDEFEFVVVTRSTQGSDGNRFFVLGKCDQTVDTERYGFMWGQREGSATDFLWRYYSYYGEPDPGDFASGPAGAPSSQWTLFTMYTNGNQVNRRYNDITQLGAVADFGFRNTNGASFGVGGSSGNMSVPAERFRGHVSEVLYYNRGLTDSERTEVRKYLAFKYGFDAFKYSFLPPTVAVTAPVNGELVVAGTAVDLMATAADQGLGSISNVEFFVNGESVGVDTTGEGENGDEYTVAWTPAVTGVYTVQAVATNDDAPSVYVDVDTITIAAALPMFVATTASGSGDGSSWANASTLADAVAALNAGDTGLPLYIKEGVYNVATSMELEKPAMIYGGFTGTEADPSDRPVGTGDPFNPYTNTTTLDGGSAVRILHANAALTLDRVYFSNGLFNAPATTEIGGGAVAARKTPLLVNDCRFTGNRAVGADGGALYIGSGVTSLITNSFFQGNSAESNGEIIGRGGAIKVDGNPGPRIEDSIFLSNSADVHAGAIDYNTTSPEGAFRCAFLNNSAGDRGGALYQDGNGTIRAFSCYFDTNTAENSGGAIGSDDGNNFRLTLFNNQFSSNLARNGDGGAIYQSNGWLLFLIHNTFHGNVAGDAVNPDGLIDGVRAGGREGGAAQVIQNNIFSGHNDIALAATGYSGANMAVDSNVFQGQATGGPNDATFANTPALANLNYITSASPLYQDAAAKNFDLLASSPARDAGSATAYFGIDPTADPDLVTDILGRMRPRGSAPDCGAYEYPDWTAINDWNMYQ